MWTYWKRSGGLRKIGRCKHISKRRRIRLDRMMNCWQWNRIRWKNSSKSSRRWQKCLWRVWNINTFVIISYITNYLISDYIPPLRNTKSDNNVMLALTQCRLHFIVVISFSIYKNGVYNRTVYKALQSYTTLTTKLHFIYHLFTVSWFSLMSMFRTLQFNRLNSGNREASSPFH